VLRAVPFQRVPLYPFLPLSPPRIKTWEVFLSAYWHTYWHRLFVKSTIHNNNNCLRPFLRDYPGEKNIHPLTSIPITPSFISFLHLRSMDAMESIASTVPPCSIYVLDSLFAPPLSRSSSVYLLVCNPPTTSHSIHFFTKSLFSFRNTCPYHDTIAICFAVQYRDYIIYS